MMPTSSWKLLRCNFDIWHILKFSRDQNTYFVRFLPPCCRNYSVPSVPLYVHMKDKLNIFGASISKWNFDFKIELRFQNGTLISKWRFDFQIELRFQSRPLISNGAFIWKWSFGFKMELWFWNQASITKWSFNFEIELRCRNEASMSKSSFDFQIEVRFQNEASISKWCFDFEIKLQFKNRALIWKWSFNFVMELRFENQPSTSKWSFGFEMKPRFQNGWNLDFKMELNPCMEIIIQKINFLKNENCSCSFFKFWNMDLNFTFRFFEMRSLISIWVSTKIETKF